MLTLEIITPDEKVLSTQADQVILPTELGEIGILSGHIPLITKIVAGELQVLGEGGAEYIAVDQGFAKILGDRVSILTEGAIDVKAIDLSEVESAQARAEEALRIAAEDELDYDEQQNLENQVQFLVAQKLSKGRRK